MDDPNVLTKRVPSKSESIPTIKWGPVIDYKRRRQSYRAKMTHLTKRTTIQEHRDIINMRMLMLAEEKGYKLEGEIDRVTTKTTPKDIEDELRRKR